MTNATQIAQRYIALWNETDPGRRSTMLAENWTDDAVYVDPMMSAAGRQEIGAMIGQVHDRFPGFRFSLAGQADGYDNKIRFSWFLGPQTEPDMIKGTDFAILEEGRLRSVTGFLDKVPASA